MSRVGDILDNPSKSCFEWSAIQYALEITKAKERGEDLHEAEFDQWNGTSKSKKSIQ